jgi:hypothetical protein
MINGLDKSCRENQNTRFTYNNFFFLENLTVYDNVEKLGRDLGATNDVRIWRTRVAWRISKATCKYVHAHAHMSGYTHTRTHALALTHRPIRNIYCFCTATIIRKGDTR